MSAGCDQCGQLRAELRTLQRVNNDLQVLIAQLKSQIRFLENRLGELIGSVGSIATFIAKQLDKPTMPRAKLLPNVQARLQDVYDQARGK